MRGHGTGRSVFWQWRASRRLKPPAFQLALEILPKTLPPKESTGLIFRWAPGSGWANRSLVEITQIGKECHKKCAIYYLAGDCIMPREGVFARVLEGGIIRCGDRIDRVGDPLC